MATATTWSATAPPCAPTAAPPRAAPTMPPTRSAPTAGATTRPASWWATGRIPTVMMPCAGTKTWFVRGWGQELSRESGGTTSAWYSSDRLGSVRGVLNNTGAVTASYDYDPYGAVETAALPADYGFTGEPQNTTYGLLQLRARWYGTSSGRFQTTDPLAAQPGDPASGDGYLYGADDPVDNTDPTGMRLDDETRGDLAAGGVN